MFIVYLLIILSVLFSSSADASTDYEKNIFAVELTKENFLYHEHMTAFLEKNKPRTFKIYNLLANDLKRKVYVAHLKENHRDLTDIVLQVYKENRY